MCWRKSLLNALSVMCLTAELKKKAGFTGLIVSDGRKKTSDSKRQFFTKVKAECFQNYLYIMGVPHFLTYPDLRDSLRSSPGAKHSGSVAAKLVCRVGLGSHLVCIYQCNTLRQGSEEGCPGWPQTLPVFRGDLEL